VNLSSLLFIKRQKNYLTLTDIRH